MELQKHTRTQTHTNTRTHTHEVNAKLTTHALEGREHGLDTIEYMPAICFNLGSVPHCLPIHLPACSFLYCAMAASKQWVLVTSNTMNYSLIKSFSKAFFMPLIFLRYILTERIHTISVKQREFSLYTRRMFLRNGNRTLSLHFTLNDNAKQVKIYYKLDGRQAIPQKCPAVLTSCYSLSCTVYISFHLLCVCAGIHRKLFHISSVGVM